MALDKLGNPTLQKQGSQSKEQTDDQTTHQLLCAMTQELRAIRIILTSMSDIDLDERDLGVDYDH